MSHFARKYMNLKLEKSAIVNHQSITITGSKSESNRLLLLQALFPNIEIENLSISDDALVMQKGLNNNSNHIDVHHAGTAMRFLTAYFATKVGSDIIITGSDRMKERPIKILVEALRNLGSDITYLENEGCPPLKIRGQKVTKNRVTLKANVSSQYISALLLIAPSLENGLELTLEGEITSMPYIKMTLTLLNNMGVKTSFKDHVIRVKPKLTVKNHEFLVESDWSSASYFYSFVALSPIGTEIILKSYKQNSLQGDSVLADIYKQFGVQTTFLNNTIQLLKVESEEINNFEFNLKNAPDIAQTLAVTCFGLSIACQLEGLHTLKIKETDRLLALKTELEKLGAHVNITNDSLRLQPNSFVKNNMSIDTYNDHRMAMAFAPIVLRTSIIINNANVVSKSYPMFWIDLKKLGIKVSE